MATTGRERRAERLNERLRGAQRVNVGDDSFSLDIEGFELPADSASSSRRTPGSSAKKRKRDENLSSTGSQQSRSTERRSTRLAAAKDPYDLPDRSKEPAGQRSPESRKSHSSGRVARSSSNREASVATHQETQEADELDTPPAPINPRSPVRSRTSGAILEEVEESPVHAPGSGRRRNVLMNDNLSSATRRLQSAVSIDDVAPPSSSPLVQKVRRSDAASVRSRRSFEVAPRSSIGEDVDELSPDRPGVLAAAEGVEMSDTLSVHASHDAAELAQPEERTDPPEEEAEEIDAEEAARILGRKRRRSSRRTSSPELGSGAAEDDQGSDEHIGDEQENDEPVPRRKRGRPSKTDHSPAVQKHPTRKPKPKPQKQPPQATQKRKRVSKPENAARRRRESGSGGGDSDGDENAIEITVQRFVNNKRRDADSGSDPLHAEIPFANRSGETVVDVFAQVCEEVIATTLAQFEQLADAAETAAKKKEYRIKMRAIEAYRQELSTRLLQHAIHLNHWYSLRKQVRQAQKEKLALRDEILRLKGEREQVALRMDAVRIKHEADSKEAAYRINMSTLMNDLDLAVDQGKEAPELSRAAQKQADLANLELLIARVSDQASSASSTGGMLRQVTDFNAFLERAALALEAR